MEALMIIGGLLGILVVYSSIQAYREFLLEKYDLNLFSSGQIFASAVVSGIIFVVVLIFESEGGISTDNINANIIVLLIFSGFIFICQLITNVKLARVHGFGAMIIQFVIGVVVAAIMLLALLLLL